VIGERLKLARKKAGLSLDKLVVAINGMVSKQAISKYERDLMMPDTTVLVALSRALDVSIEYLLSDDIVSLSGVDFRKTVRASAKDRARVEASVIDHLERYLAIEEILELDSAEWQHPNLGEMIIEAASDAEAFANNLRIEWELGEDPIPDMTVLLEENGIKVLVLDLPDSISGMTCFASRREHPASLPVVVVNKRKSLERRRFTLAHELAHRVFNSDHFDCSRDEENAAQRFAGAFLMHADHLRREAGSKREKIGYQEIVYLKRMYRVSAAALAMRLEQIGIIAKATLSTIFQTIGRTWRTVEPDPLEEAGKEGMYERPKRFERLSLWALAEQYISPGKAMELLQFSLVQLERAMAGPHARNS